MNDAGPDAPVPPTSAVAQVDWPPQASPPTPVQRSPPLPWSKRLVALVPFLLLTGAASWVYFDEIDRVHEIYFDEHYYVTVGRQIDNGIWEDPCWINDGELDHRPLNYEHPPLAKLMIALSIRLFDTNHAIFEGCRSPDDTNPQSCDVTEHGRYVTTTASRKDCYDNYIELAKTRGNPIAWRLPSALMGICTVLFIGLAAQRLFGPRDDEPALPVAWPALVMPVVAGASAILLALLAYLHADWAYGILAAGQVLFAVFLRVDARMKWALLGSAFLAILWGALGETTLDLAAVLLNVVLLVPFVPDQRRWLPGILAGTLVLTDTLVFSSARIALLDIFAAGFTAIAVYCATFPGRRGVIFTALFLGLAFCCKYTVVFAGPGVALLSLWSQRRGGQLTRRRFDLNLACFVLIPLAVWILTYIPWWAIWIPDMGVVGAVSHWIDVQKAAFVWGARGYQVHDYSTQPIDWIAMKKPTFYYHVWGFSDGKEGWVYAVGNPLLWWAASLAAVAAIVGPLVGWARAFRDRAIGPFAWFTQQPLQAQALLLTGVLAASTYGFFFLVDRVTFLFYMTLVVPLGALVLGGTLHHLLQRSLADRLVAALVLVAILAAFLYYLPVASADRITPEHFHAILRRVPWMEE